MSNIYYEPTGTGRHSLKFSKKKLPLYPKSLRFDNPLDLNRYYAGINQFIQSTKIPTSCDKCPIKAGCFYLRGDYCRRTWRKIWEYVK